MRVSIEIKMFQEKLRAVVAVGLDSYRSTVELIPQAEPPQLRIYYRTKGEKSQVVEGGFLKKYERRNSYKPETFAFLFPLPYNKKKPFSMKGVIHGLQ